MGMITKPKKIAKTIIVDVSRQTEGGNEQGGKILMYDSSEKCYYETTVEFVASVIMRQVREYEEKLDAKFDEFAKNIDEQQRHFIADTAKTNQAIINLVRGGTKDD